MFFVTQPFDPWLYVTLLGKSQYIHSLTAMYHLIELFRLMLVPRIASSDNVFVQPGVNVKDMLGCMFNVNGRLVFHFLGILFQCRYLFGTFNLSSLKFTSWFLSFSKQFMKPSYILALSSSWTNRSGISIFGSFTNSKNLQKLYNFCSYDFFLGLKKGLPQ